ncbi:MAG: carboxylesterase family protein [Ferruginibacter sp.]|nr:carboxylesterase family protein [Ferruginibacter sp.]
MTKLLFTTWVSALMVLTAFSQTDNYLPVQTTVENGVIEGRYDTKTGMQLYLGVPFAKPPVGPLRWKAPQPLANWQGVKNTKKFGPRAVQGIVFGDMGSRSEGLSEDCLYLNVWTPAKRTTKNLPVLVYFYGGGFVAGDGAEPRYDGESMAAKGMVAVTVNYRLGVFGFLAHPELSAEAPYKASGNYGLLDQQAALKWVQKNIAAFGGDPKRVTIAGESAGSISVSYQMASPLSKDLIAGAIGESGAGIYPTLAPIKLDSAEKVGLEFAKKAGYSTLAELRKLSTRDLFEIYAESKRFGFPVVIDGYFLKSSLPEVFAAKQQAMVPVLVGWNSAEIPGAAFMYGMPPYTKENYVTRLKKEYPNDHEEVLKLYPGDSAKQIEYSATALASDRFIAYSTWKWADLQLANSSKPVYRYLYSKLRPPLANQQLTAGLAGGTLKKDAKAPKAPEAIGAPHACEIEYCMGNLHLVKDFAWTPEDYKVSETMQNYFANFIINGDPNGAKLPVWPAAKAGDKNPDVMVIDVESKSVKSNDEGRYRFLDKSYTSKK